MRPFDYLLYAGVIIGWSTSWYPLSLQMGTIPAEVSLFWRFAAAALLTFGIARGVRVVLRYGRADHLRFACLGVVLFSTNFAFFYNASLYGASGLLAVILSTTSLVNVLMVAVVSRRRPPVQQLAASVTGLAGSWADLPARVARHRDNRDGNPAGWGGHIVILHRQSALGGHTATRGACAGLYLLGYALWYGIHGSCVPCARP